MCFFFYINYCNSIHSNAAYWSWRWWIWVCSLNCLPWRTSRTECTWARSIGWGRGVKPGEAALTNDSAKGRLWRGERSCLVNSPMCFYSIWWKFLFVSVTKLSGNCQALHFSLPRPLWDKLMAFFPSKKKWYCHVLVAPAALQLNTVLGRARRSWTERKRSCLKLYCRTPSTF